MKNSNNWSTALYEISLEFKELARNKKIASEILETIDESDSLVRFLSDNFISKKEKIEFINKVISNSNKNFKNFLNVLIEENRCSSLKNILTSFIVLVNKKLKIKETTVWTTFQIDNSLLNKIKKLVEKKYKFNVEIKNKIDLNLIGGIKLEIDNTVIDYSILSNIQKMKNELMKEMIENGNK